MTLTETSRWPAEAETLLDDLVDLRRAIPVSYTHLDVYKRQRFANDEGRILPGLYCVGWARRGPSGTIGTNKPDGARIAEMVLEDIGRGGGKAGRPGLDALLAGFLLYTSRCV